MTTFIFLLIIFLLILALALALSVGSAFLLVWLFPEVSFEIGVVVGAVCSTFTVLAFSKLLSFSMMFDTLFEKNDKPEEEYDLESEYDEEEDEEVYIVPVKSSARKNRNRRRRR